MNEIKGGLAPHCLASETSMAPSSHGAQLSSRLDLGAAVWLPGGWPALTVSFCHKHSPGPGWGLELRPMSRGAAGPRILQQAKG